MWLDYPLERDVTLKDMQNVPGQAPPKSRKMVYTNRQDAVALLARRPNDPVLQEKAAEPDVPAVAAYAWQHFWKLLELCGEHATLQDIQLYCELFAPAANTTDKYLLCVIRNTAAAYIKDLKGS